VRQCLCLVILLIFPLHVCLVVQCICQSDRNGLQRAKLEQPFAMGLLVGQHAEHPAALDPQCDIARLLDGPDDVGQMLVLCRPLEHDLGRALPQADVVGLGKGHQRIHIYS